MDNSVGNSAEIILSTGITIPQSILVRADLVVE